MPLIKRASASHRKHGLRHSLDHGEPSTSPSSPASEDIIVVHAAPRDEVRSSTKIDDNPFAYFITPPSTPGPRTGSDRAMEDEDEDESFFTLDDLQAAGITPTRPRSPFRRTRSRPKMSHSPSSSSLSLPLPFPSFSAPSPQHYGHRNLHKLRQWVLHMPESSSASEPSLSPESPPPLSRSPPAPHLRPQPVGLDDIPPFATLSTIAEEEEDDDFLLDDDDDLDLSEEDDDEEEPALPVLELDLSTPRGRGRQPNRFAPQRSSGRRDAGWRGTGSGGTARRMRGKVWRKPGDHLWTIWEDVDEA
ncbi:MAG: hypothetical protein M1817_004640 [Caeruleum heppii]|nr:MAG: hypothetical protein M1817_004640 [Caeruleum heppii]